MYKFKSKLKFSALLIIIGIFFIVASFGPLIKDEVWFYLKQFKNQQMSLSTSGGEKDSAFARFLTSTPIQITPVNKDFSLVIEKIGVNAPIVADVPVDNEEAYKEALQHGIAQAITSDYPTKSPSNVYLFAHTSLGFWDLGGYATVFNLLHQLSIGDPIHVFYKNSDYVYIVVNKEIVGGWNTFPLTRPTIEPLLTLQTCDPPGTTLNRLIITAKLKEVL